MEIIWQILAGLTSLVAFVMFVIVLIKLFQREGALKGILGIICALYTFVWGWMKNKEENITTFMWIWTAAIILGVIFNLLSTMMAIPPPTGG